MGHERTEDDTDFDQTPDRYQVEGHEYIEHADGTTDQDGE